MASRPGHLAQPHQGDPAQTTGFDHLGAAGTHRITVNAQSADATAPTPLQGFVDAEDQGAIAAIQVLEQQYQQNTRGRTGRPHRPVEHLMVAGEVAVIAATHDPQRRGHRALAWRQYRAHQQHLRFAPGWVAEQRCEGNENGYNGIGQGEHGWTFREKWGQAILPCPYSFPKKCAKSRQGPTTFGLRKWETAPVPKKPASRRGRTGDVVYALLLQDGPAIIDDVIKSLQKSTSIKERTIREAINRDPENRFVRIGDGRIAANPIPGSNNPNAPTLTVVPDGHTRQPTPVLQASELRWLTHYVQALNDLEPPPPSRAALSGPRAAGFALDDPMEIVVVVDDRSRANLESRLAQAAEVASESVPSVQPQISILSVEQWTKRMDGATPEAHHNLWLAPDTASRTDAA